MSTTMLLKSYSPPPLLYPSLLPLPSQLPLSVTVTSDWPIKSWPTMYDLPSETPEDPGLPDIFHDQQPQLLKETFQSPCYPSNNVFIATDLNLYYDRQHTHWYKRPDWFVVVGVPKFYQNRDLRYSYVMWDEQVAPMLVVELLSQGTEDEDLGLTSSPIKGPPTKWEVYERILKIPYYVVFDRKTSKVQFFELTTNGYVELPATTNSLWIPKIQLGLKVWKGVYDEFEHQWLRWFDSNGQWIPTLLEYSSQVEQQAEQKIKQAEQKIVQVEQQAEQKLRQAEQKIIEAQQQTEKLAAHLRALGINPDQW